MLGNLFDKLRSDLRGRNHSLFERSYPPTPPERAATGPVASSAQALPGTDVRRLALRDAFTHTRPQRNAARFVGRQPQISRILRALTVEHAHVVIYGERGRGKTSLGNVVAEALRQQGHTLARHTCAADSNYDSIIRGLARSLPRTFLGSSMAVAAPTGPAGDGCEGVLPAGSIQPNDVVVLSTWLNGRRIVFMIDEFDRVVDRPTRTRFADTIKQLSDRCVPISFMLLGVSDSLEQLLGLHPSIQRNVVGIPLPLLGDADIEDILVRGAAAAGLEFPASARTCIKALARGAPYMAQLLALHSGHAALDRQATVVAGCDIAAAVTLAVAEADPRIIALTDTLTDNGRHRAMAALLSAIATGEQDEYGRFRVTEAATRHELRVAGRRVDPRAWQRLLDAGAVRACAGTAPGLYVTTEPALSCYVLLKRVRDAGAPGA